MREGIRFLSGSKLVEIDQLDPTTTVLDWLRLHARRTGTKEGCNEGDCGACTVVLGRLEGERVVYRAVNACIQLLATLDGCRLLTVEDLKRADGTLHPVQQAMVECHASQCGFCTPGFVMSLLALTQEHETAPDRRTIDEALSGNLCRCTGYAPIARAASRAFEIDGRRLDDCSDGLRALADGDSYRLSDGSRCFHAPATLDELSALLAERPEAVIIAGCTDVGLWITKQMRVLRDVVWIGRIDALRHIEEGPAGLEIGAGVTWSEAEQALTRLYPEKADMLARFASVPIRNSATVGGNIANGSPIGDGSPALIATGATLHLRKGEATRSLPLEDFFIAYGEQDRAPGEFVERVTVPRPAAGSHYRCYKLSKRLDQDISAVLGAFMIRLDGDRVAEARLVYGGMAATPKRASRAEQALIGQPWSRASVGAAMDALSEDFAPIDDMRASAAYRMRTARNMLRRFSSETTEPEIATRVGALESITHG